jgi:hypothetical protein
MGTTKIIDISNRDSSNAQVTTWQTNDSEKKDGVMFDVSSVVEFVLRITRDERSTRTYKWKHTHLSVSKYTLLPHESNPIHSTRSNNFGYLSSTQRHSKARTIRIFLQYPRASVHRKRRLQCCIPIADPDSLHPEDAKYSKRWKETT